MRYVSIDVESTGLDPTYCQVLEIGAVVDDFGLPIGEAGPPFHCYVVHERVVGQVGALVLNAGILGAIHRRKELAGEYRFLEPDCVADAFVAWLADVGLRKEIPVFAAKNFAFDWGFLSQTIPDWSRRVRKRHRCLDPGPLYFAPREDDVPPSLPECLARAGIAHDVNHRAVDDAVAVVKLLRHHYLGDWR